MLDLRLAHAQYSRREPGGMLAQRRVEDRRPAPYVPGWPQFARSYVALQAGIGVDPRDIAGHRPRFACSAALSAAALVPSVPLNRSSAVASASACFRAASHVASFGVEFAEIPCNGCGSGLGGACGSWQQGRGGGQRGRRDGFSAGQFGHGFSFTGAAHAAFCCNATRGGTTVRINPPRRHDLLPCTMYGGRNKGCPRPYGRSRRSRIEARISARPIVSA